MDSIRTLNIETLLAKVREIETENRILCEKVEQLTRERDEAIQQCSCVPGQPWGETELQQGDACCQQLNERFYKAFLMNPSLMWIVTVRDRVHVDVNEAYAQALGTSREKIIGCTTDKINIWQERKTRGKVAKLLLETGKITNYEVQYRHKLRGQRYALMNAELVVIAGEPCFFTVLTDITERKYLENEMARFDRLNLVGQMAAAIGHEVRNPMTAVRGFLQIFLQKAELNNYQEHFSIMIEELDRANSILTEFLSLAKDKTVELQRASLNNVIEAIFPLLQADAFRLGHNIIVEAGEISEFEFDEKEIRQLILNLVRNGLEAMEQAGTVKIKTYTVDGKIVLAVQDSGSGISPAIMDKLGTPFLTTKGTGTGLGLPVCYRIVERHGAHIAAHSGPGGTLFTVTFNQDKAVAKRKLDKALK